MCVELHAISGLMWTRVYLVHTIGGQVCVLMIVMINVIIVICKMDGCNDLARLPWL